MSKQKNTFDATTKTFYGKLFKNLGLGVETEREIFSQARSIDLVVTCVNYQQHKLQETVFSHFRQLNAIELKGYNDALTTKDFNRIMMRYWGLGAVDFVKNEDKTPSLKPSQRTLTIICVIKPKKILDETDEYHFKATEQAGIYHSSGQLDIWLIHPSELKFCPENYPLLALARGEKLQQFIDLCLKQGLIEYLELILYVGLTTDPEIIWQKIVEVSAMRHIIHEETWPIIDEFFRQMPEAMGKLTTFQDVLIEKLREGQQKGRLEGIQADKKSVLLRLLKQKFQIVPQSVVAKIQKTDDIQRLDAWLDKLLVANHLNEMKF